MSVTEIVSGVDYTSAGIYCKAGNFYCDPHKPATHAVVTHAHSDHAIKGNEHVYCTPYTAALMKARYGNSIRSTFHLYEYEEPFRINNIDLCFYSAGHILGSAQVLMHLYGERVLYTGDIKLQGDKTCAPYQSVGCDVLITESTFANPEVVHPNDVGEIIKLNDYPGINILLGGYVLGKAQRILSMVEQHCPMRMVLCHNDIVPFNKVYADAGIRFENWIPYSRRYFKQHNHCIYLVPPTVYKYYYNRVKTIKAFATGWKRLQHDADFEMYISDHVDWPDLVDVITQSGAGKVVTLHGDGSALKAHFEGSGKEFLILK